MGLVEHATGGHPARICTIELNQHWRNIHDDLMTLINYLGSPAAARDVTLNISAGSKIRDVRVETRVMWRPPRQQVLVACHLLLYDSLGLADAPLARLAP